MSISPNACVIEKNKPIFIGVSEILKRSTQRTVDLLKLEPNKVRRTRKSMALAFIRKNIYRK